MRSTRSLKPILSDANVPGGTAKVNMFSVSQATLSPASLPARLLDTGAPKIEKTWRAREVSVQPPTACQRGATPVGSIPPPTSHVPPRRMTQTSMGTSNTVDSSRVRLRIVPHSSEGLIEKSEALCARVRTGVVICCRASASSFVHARAKLHGYEPCTYVARHCVRCSAWVLSNYYICK